MAPPRHSTKPSLHEGERQLGVPRDRARRSDQKRVATCLYSTLTPVSSPITGVGNKGVRNVDWLAVGTFVGGLVGGYTIKAVLNIRSNKSHGDARARGRSVAQSGNVAGGHVAGRDIKIGKK